MVALVVFRYASMTTPTNCYLVSLAAADCLVLLAAVPQVMFSLMFPKVGGVPCFTGRCASGNDFFFRKFIFRKSFFLMLTRERFLYLAGADCLILLAAVPQVTFSLMFTKESFHLSRADCLVLLASGKDFFAVYQSFL